MSSKRVLVAPLNWGLGHATRCVPIVRHLLELDHEVILASDGLAGQLLQREFPTLTHVTLPSYEIQYPQSLVWLYWLQKAGNLRRVFIEENEEIGRIVDRYAIDFIISDNRYGVYHPSVPSVIITHQLSFAIPIYLQWVAHQQLDRWLSPFDECWVPDVRDKGNLSGSLSARQPSVPVRFIGPLSRMNPVAREIRYDVTVVLSGPEPHRSILQSKLTSKLGHLNMRIAWVMGTPDQQSHKERDTDVYPFLGSSALNELLCSSELIISRSGYSSLMDYYQLNKKAILIPTPGQPEQRYLAKRHGGRPEFLINSEELSDLNNQIVLLQDVVPDLPQINQHDGTLRALLHERLEALCID